MISVGSEVGEVPTTEPGPEHAALGFVAAVQGSFGFLENDYGFRLVRAEPTFVRYEGERRFVNVFHGRSSYELGVEIGRWVEVDGEVAEQRFGLGYVVALSREPDSVGFRAFTATDADTVARFVLQLAEWTRDFGASALAGGDAAFERMSARIGSRFADLLAGGPCLAVA